MHCLSLSLKLAYVTLMRLCHVNVYVCCFDEINCGFVCLCKVHCVILNCTSRWPSACSQRLSLLRRPVYKPILSRLVVLCIVRFINLTTTASSCYSFYCRLVIVSWEQIYQLWHAMLPLSIRLYFVCLLYFCLVCVFINKKTKTNYVYYVLKHTQMYLPNVVFPAVSSAARQQWFLRQSLLQTNLPSSSSLGRSSAPCDDVINFSIVKFVPSR